MTLAYIVILLTALIAGVFGECAAPDAVSQLDPSQLVGDWQGYMWPENLARKYKCGNQSFSIDSNHINYNIWQYDIPKSEWSSSSGRIRQIGNSGKFNGVRSGLDTRVRWVVVGISENKWLTYWLCREDNGNNFYIILKKPGVTLSSEDRSAASATIPANSDYSPVDYSNCPQ